MIGSLGVGEVLGGVARGGNQALGGAEFSRTVEENARLAQERYLGATGATGEMVYKMGKREIDTGDRNKLGEYAAALTEEGKAYDVLNNVPGAKEGYLNSIYGPDLVDENVVDHFNRFGSVASLAGEALRKLLDGRGQRGDEFKATSPLTERLTFELRTQPKTEENGRFQGGLRKAIADIRRLSPFAKSN